MNYPVLMELASQREAHIATRARDAGRRSPLRVRTRRAQSANRSEAKP